MANLPFIDTDLFTDAFRKDQQFQAEQQARERNNQFNAAADPSRLRQITYDSDIAGTKAMVGAATAPYDISKARSGASLEQTNAGVAAATAPARISEAQSGSRLRSVEADVAEQTAPSKIAEQRSKATNEYMESWYKSLDLLHQGRIQEAQEASRQGGHGDIPPRIIQDGDMQAYLLDAAKTAKEMYPGRPLDQFDYMHKAAADAQTRQGQGQPANQPGAQYNVTGAPTPQQIGGTTARPGETQQIITQLLNANPNLTYEQALNEAKRGSNVDQNELRRESLALSAAKADPAFQNKPGDTLERYRAQYGLPPMAAVPQPPAAPPSRPWFGQGGSIYDSGGSAPAAAPGPAGPQASAGPPQVREGATATNPQNGAKVVYHNGQWVPMPAPQAVQTGPVVPQSQ
jgi:hypothetical protein